MAEYLNPVKLKSWHYDLMGYQGRYEFASRLYRLSYNNQHHDASRKLLEDWNNEFALHRLRGTHVSTR